MGSRGFTTSGAFTISSTSERTRHQSSASGHGPPVSNGTYGTAVEVDTGEVRQGQGQGQDTCRGDKGAAAKPPRQPMTNSQKLRLVMLCFTNYSGILLYSVIAPFFPGVAQSKGVDQTVTGLIFGIYELVTFLASPVFGKVASGIGFKFVYVSGIYMCGACSILFGFVDRSPDGAVFVAMCFVVRIAEGIATGAFMTAGFAMASIVFWDRKSMVMGMMETCLCLGLMSGPPIGGVLYELGGFQLPFIVVGCVLFICGSLGWYLIPSINTTTHEETGSGAGITNLLRIPGVSLCVACVVVASITVGFIEPTLELHLRQFNMSPALVGAFFLCLTGAYAASAPFWGWLADLRVFDPKYMMLFGSVSAIISLNLVGPAEFFPFNTELWLVGVSLAVMAFGIEGMYVPPFTESFHEANINGFPDNFGTNSLIAGLFSAAFHFGSFVGPTIGGPMVQYLGFGAAGSYISLAHILMMILLSIVLLKKRRTMKHTKALHLRKNKNTDKCVHGEQEEFEESYPLLPSG